jgi:hypothetical protein
VNLLSCDTNITVLMTSVQTTEGQEGEEITC